MRHATYILTAAFVLSTAAPALADPPSLVKATATPSGMGWNIHVTVAHGDTGWDHYADGWEILDDTGKVLGFRKLHHPHVDEQPFTRSLNNVMIPDGSRKIYVRLRCNLDGWKDKRYEVMLDR